MANGQPEEPGKPPVSPVPVQIIVAPAAPGAMEKSEPLPVKEVPKTSREAALKWLTEQGVSTVLLFSIVVLLAIGVPRYVIPAIQGGYERNATSYEKTMKMQIDARDSILKQIMDEHGRDREVFKDAIRERRP